MDTESLKKNLEQKTFDVFEKHGGSLVVQAYTDAKTACLDAGIPEAEVNEIVDAAIRGERRCP